jgi:hypothetical protein
LAAAGLVVVLALTSLFWPRAEMSATAPRLLVFDGSGVEDRVDGVFGRLRDVLGHYLDERSRGGMQLVVVRTVAEFKAELALGPAFVLAPDGLALRVSGQNYVPLVVGRRPAPRNLRPSGVVVYRRSAGDVAAPWLVHARRTVFGDSLSLTATGVLRTTGRTSHPRGCAYGPDVYDHGPALHALRLGGFDYAVVREWDAERFREAGLLPATEFGIRDLVAPVPDTVLLAARSLPARIRLDCGDGLSSVGRQAGNQTGEEREFQNALGAVNLAGFNLLLEPDFEAVRKNFEQDWLPGRD